MKIPKWTFHEQFLKFFNRRFSIKQSRWSVEFLIWSANPKTQRNLKHTRDETSEINFT